MGNDLTRDLAEGYSRSHISKCQCMGMGFVRINVPVGDPLFGAAIPCICRRDQNEKDRAERLRKRSGITEDEARNLNMDEFRVEDCIPRDGQDPQETITLMAKVKETCKRYAQRPRGWLILQGEKGVGKTHLAYALGIEGLKAGHAVYFNTVAAVMDLLRNGYKDDLYQALMDDLIMVEILILDDLGAEKDSEWVMEKLLQLIDTRYRRQMPIVITTNYAIDDPKCGIDSRILSRLRDGIQAGNEGFVHILRLAIADYRPTNKTYRKVK